MLRCVWPGAKLIRAAVLYMELAAPILWPQPVKLAFCRQRHSRRGKRVWSRKIVAAAQQKLTFVKETKLF